MKREIWIDVMKGIAILAVVADHAFYIFYQYRNYYIWQHTFFAITWFIFLSGITNTLSAMRGKWVFTGSWLIFWLKRLRNILSLYIFASFIIYFYGSYPNIQIVQFVSQLVNFAVQPTYYFINLLLQLYFIFPFLYFLIMRIKSQRQIIFVSLAIFLLSFTVLSPTYALPWPFYSLGMIFGGKYLFVFYLGMLYAKKIFKETKIILAVLALIFVVDEIVINTVNIFTFRTISLASILWSMSFFFLIKKALGMPPVPNPAKKLMAIIGRFSLPIYLFHYYFLTLLNKAR